MLWYTYTYLNKYVVIRYLMRLPLQDCSRQRSEYFPILLTNRRKLHCKTSESCRNKKRVGSFMFIHFRSGSEFRVVRREPSSSASSAARHRGSVLHRSGGFMYMLVSAVQPVPPTFHAESTTLCKRDLYCISCTLSPAL